MTMCTCKLLVCTGFGEPDLGQGYALADTLDEALELARHPEAIALPTEKMWPGRPGERVFWSYGPMPREAGRAASAPPQTATSGHR